MLQTSNAEPLLLPTVLPDGYSNSAVSLQQVSAGCRASP